MVATLSNAAVWLTASGVISWLVKATLILIVALAVAWSTRTARASARHLVLATAFAALLVLPLLIINLPSRTIAVPADPPTWPLHRYGTMVRPFAEDPANRIGMASQAAMNQIGQINPSTLAWLWLAGVTVFLAPVASALWRLSMIRRTGLPVAWHRAELSRLADGRGVALPIELLEHEAVPGPMTFGITRPVIVLPLDAREWSEAELRRALMHEIEHIQRGDWLMQIVARTVAAFYWFHPLVWTAWRRLCLEAERSCDDAVVISEDSADYADQLVTLARRMSAAPVPPMLGMANRSDLSTRVTAVLDDRLRRGRAGLALAAGTMTAAAVVLMTVAPVRAIARAEGDAIAVVTARDEQAPKKYLPGQRKSRALDLELYEAAKAGDLEGVKELVEAGANPSAKIDGDGSPLIGAARSRRTEITKFLLDAGADPNGVVEGDGSPLIQAAAVGRYEQVDLLIQHGADVNLAVQGDENPLMNAAEQGHLEVVKLLVARGADVHTKIWTDKYPTGGEWRTAISQARKNGHVDVVRYLESRGARE